MTPQPEGSAPADPDSPLDDVDFPSPEEDGFGFWAKLVLTAFPFLLVFLFLILEWWVRGRSG